MASKKIISAPAARLQLLAEFRHQLRLFLHFSEAAALKMRLHPQQHQLLLQIAGAPDRADATIGYAAERLSLRHNTVVELSNRCEQAGLIVRKQAGCDRRSVLLGVSPKGRALLEALSAAHARELDQLAPQLIRTLRKLRPAPAGKGKRAARGGSEI